MSLNTTLTARRLRSSAFTLIELLTVIAIIGVLAAILIPTVGACRAHAAKTVELSAARQLMVGYHLYASENRGRLLPLQEIGVSGTTNEQGSTISGIEGIRWPHRLRPYLGDRFRDTLYVNTQAEYYNSLTGTANADYTLSVGPSLGLNGPFVGGDASSLIKDVPVRSVAQAAAPPGLITFASAHYRVLNEKSGYWRIGSPSAGWPVADLNGLPSTSSQDAAYGWIAYRHQGKAVVAYLDSHVELHTSAELRDMRLWSDVARRTNNPDYVPAQ
jgi:prepilin-type N-terminal cleavage/methylation domain-containing protein/prepilin-type processing-associated H-X9-DG protein